MIKRSTKVLFTDEIDVDKILVSKKEPYDKKSSFKYFIGYNDTDFLRPLCIKLPQIIGYVEYFNSNKRMRKVIDNKLLEKYTKIWERVSILMNIEFDSSLFIVIEYKQKDKNEVIWR